MKHKPACILDIRVPAGTFDVNLTPDKREIILSHGVFISWCGVV
jgi:DNA mismatch repair ATPase MutL